MTETEFRTLHTHSAISSKLPKRLNGFALYLMSLAVMIGLYSLYARILAPIIEGPSQIVQHQFQPPSVELPTQHFNQAKLAQLFPEHAWELGECKVLLTDQGLVMFRDFHRVEGGYLEVLPFTLITQRAEVASTTSQTSSENPTVLRCFKGARLKFDDPDSDPLAGKSKLESARLVGSVDIYRPASHTEKDDAIEILTSNVQIDRRQIYTIDEVKFAFGSHRGQGRQMSIEFLHEEGAFQQQGLDTISGIKRIELAYLKQLQLLQKKHPQETPAAIAPLPATTPVSNPAARLSQPSDPVNITCGGPFVLDLERQTATFNDQVRVSMEGENQSEINCKRLTVYFNSKAKPASQPLPANSSANPSASWDLQRLIAEGAPATFFSHSHSANVTGNILGYDLIKQEIVAQQRANSTLPVTIVTPELNFNAIQVAYRLKAGGGLGEIIAQGPGRLLKPETAKDREFFVEWDRLLSVEPDGAQQLITIADGCHIRFDKTTHIKAKQLKLWLNEVEADPHQDRRDEAPSRQYQPDRLMATQNVEIISPQLNGKTEKLTASWSLSEIPLQKQALQKVRTELERGDRIAMREPRADLTSQRAASIRIQRTAMRVQEPSDEFTPGTEPTGMQPIKSYRSADRSTPAQVVGEVHPWPGESNYHMAPAIPRAQHTDGVRDENVRLANIEFDQPDPTLPAKRYTFRGNEVDLQLLYHGETTVIEELTSQGDIELSEVADAFAELNRSPLTIRGQHLRCLPQADESVRVIVSGDDRRLAMVTTDRFELTGSQIHLDQSTNKMWVDGRGEIELQPQTPNEKTAPGGNLALGQPPIAGQAPGVPSSNYDRVRVSWLSGMVFDGRKVYFEDDVKMVASGQNNDGETVNTSAAGQGVTLELNQQVNFRDLESDAKQPIEIREVVIVNQVAGGQRVFNLAKANLNQGLLPNAAMASITHQTSNAAGGLTEQQKFLASQITMDIRSGLVTSSGPGALVHHRRGGKPMMAGSSRNRSQPNVAPAQGGGEVSFVRINFEGTANASMHDKRLVIRGNVRTIYANVDSFEKELNPDATHSLPEDAVKVKCERLDFSQWTPRNATESVQELLASGNAHVTSGSFEAVADQIRYNQGTDTLVVEGTARSDAQLWYHPVGSPRERQHLVAQKIIYRLSDQSTEVQGIKNIDIKK